MVKNLPCSVRTVGLIPVRGTKILHAMGQLNPHLTVRASLHHHKISHMMDAVMILHAASKTRCSQISKYSKTKMQKLGPYFRPTEPEFLRPRPFLVKKFPRGFLWLLFIPASQATAIVFGLLEVPKLRVVKAKEEKTFYLCVRIMGFVDGSVVKIHLQCRRPWFDSWVGKIPWRRGRLPTPVCLGFPCGSGGEESACNAGDLGSILGWEEPLEKGKTTHSSVLAWRIPWTV